MPSSLADLVKRYGGDVGFPGPDAGKGRKYLSKIRCHSYELAEIDDISRGAAVVYDLRFLFV